MKRLKKTPSQLLLISAFVGFLSVILIALAWNFWFKTETSNSFSKVPDIPQVNPPKSGQRSTTPTPKPTTVPTLPNTKQTQTLDIPFISQAPLGDWSDPRQQDGCEEAASLMAVYWARGLKIKSKEDALKEILSISAYQEQNFGEFRDSSAQDTMNRIIKGYFSYGNVSLRQNIQANDIIEEIQKGHAIIVPTNGQALGNPYFTAPGPERHMLIIKGFDFKTNEFITNDNGTRQGENFRYKKEVLFNAIRDYPSGYHQPILGVEKTMIVVTK